MSAIRSALAELQIEDLNDVELGRLGDDLVEIEQVSGLLERERCRRLVAFEKRHGPPSEGYSSVTAYLMHRCGMSRGRAHRTVTTAHGLEDVPAVAAAWEDGSISTDQMQLLVQTAAAAPEEFADAEKTLVDAVQGLSVADTRRAVHYWRSAVDGPGQRHDEKKLHDRRGLSVSRLIDGMRRVDGWLPPDMGEIWEEALNAAMRPPAVGDPRTPRQRRADAATDIMRAFLEHPDADTAGGQRPHLTIITDLEALAGIGGGTHETIGGEVVSVETLRQVACDAAVCRIILGPNSEVIDLGRERRTVSAAQRRAVIARDRHCTWPGCERPAPWCDVHHKKHWHDHHGPTDLDNLCLLCRFHHTLTHRDRSQDGRQDHPRPPRAPPA